MSLMWLVLRWHIAEYTGENSWHYPIKRRVTFASALELWITVENSPFSSNALLYLFHLYLLVWDQGRTWFSCSICSFTSEQAEHKSSAAEQRCPSVLRSIPSSEVVWLAQSYDLFRKNMADRFLLLLRYFLKDIFCISFPKGVRFTSMTDIILIIYCVFLLLAVFILHLLSFSPEYAGVLESIPCHLIYAAVLAYSEVKASTRLKEVKSSLPLEPTCFFCLMISSLWAICICLWRSNSSISRLRFSRWSSRSASRASLASLSCANLSWRDS